MQWSRNGIRRDRLEKEKEKKKIAILGDTIELLRHSNGYRPLRQQSHNIGFHCEGEHWGQEDNILGQANEGNKT